LSGSSEDVELVSTDAFGDKVMQALDELLRA